MVHRPKKLKRPKVSFEGLSKEEKDILKKELEALKRRHGKPKEPPRRKIKRAVPSKKKK